MNGNHTTPAAMLDIRSAGKFYNRPEGTVRDLDDVSLHVGAGELVAVQGPSGCGKTTLLLIAGGLLAPDEGVVLVGGQDPYGMSAEGRARYRGRTIGFVFQQFHLIPYLDVLENVMAAALPFGKTDARGRAEELIARFGLTDRAGHLPEELSTGERQRTAMARALLNSPKLLLADEPTGNLDSDNSDAVLGYLAEFARDGGAVLLVTHDPRVADYARRTVRMEAGRALRGDAVDAPV